MIVVTLLCIAWPLWVMLLCHAFKQSMAADAVATMLGFLVIIAAGGVQ